MSPPPASIPRRGANSGTRSTASPRAASPSSRAREERMTGFSAARFRALLLKEFIQAFRDRLTFAMMVGVPIIQLVLFGYAINSDPHYLPTAVVSVDNSEMSRSILGALQNSAYFKVVAQPSSEAEAERMITRGDVQFVVTIPEDFARKLVRGERPVLLVEA